MFILHKISFDRNLFGCDKNCTANHSYCAVNSINQLNIKESIFTRIKKKKITEYNITLMTTVNNSYIKTLFENACVREIW